MTASNHAPAGTTGPDRTTGPDHAPAGTTGPDRTTGPGRTTGPQGTPTLVVTRRLLRGYGPLAVLALALLLMALLVPTTTRQQPAEAPDGASAPAPTQPITATDDAPS